MLAEVVMEAEVAAPIGAGHGERSPERTTWRNGYRPRRWDTRAGTIELQIAKLRQGSHFPALLEPRRRAERALLAVVQQAYVDLQARRRRRRHRAGGRGPRLKRRGSSSTSGS